MASFRLVVLGVVVGLAAGVGGCDRSDGGPPAGSATAGVCEAAAAAAGGDLSGARAAFLDVHGQLHAIADRLASDGESASRSLAADLLRAKQQVEEEVERPQRGELEGRLRSLATATAAAESLDPADACT